MMDNGDSDDDMEGVVGQVMHWEWFFFHGDEVSFGCRCMLSLGFKASRWSSIHLQSTSVIEADIGTTKGSKSE